eukprot:ANDGO_08328.mRNA.1 hypothetical protein
MERSKSQFLHPTSNRLLCDAYPSGVPAGAVLEMYGNVDCPLLDTAYQLIASCVMPRTVRVQTGGSATAYALDIQGAQSRCTVIDTDAEFNVFRCISIMTADLHRRIEQHSMHHPQLAHADELTLLDDDYDSAVKACLSRITIHRAGRPEDLLVLLRTLSSTAFASTRLLCICPLMSANIQEAAGAPSGQTIASASAAAHGEQELYTLACIARTVRELMKRYRFSIVAVKRAYHVLSSQILTLGPNVGQFGHRETASSDWGSLVSMRIFFSKSILAPPQDLVSQQHDGSPVVPLGWVARVQVLAPNSTRSTHTAAGSRQNLQVSDSTDAIASAIPSGTRYYITYLTSFDHGPMYIKWTL